MVLYITAIRGYAVNLSFLLIVVYICLSFRPEELDAKSLASNEWNNLKPPPIPFAKEHPKFHNNLLRKDKSSTRHQVNTQTIVVVPHNDYSQHQQLELNEVITGSSLRTWDRQNTTSTTTTTPSSIPTGASLQRALLSLQNPRLLGGDILIRTHEGKRKKDYRLANKYQRSVLLSPVSLWPDGVIFYELHPSVAHLTHLLWKVMQQFHDETCIRFMPRKDNEPDFLHIMSVTGCYSYIGRIGGEQNLSLSDGCEYRGTIAHELLHAVGFYHHQNRSDRDDYLEILWDNIDEDKRDQFDKIIPQHESMWQNEFDYNSIMLYGPHTFGQTLDKVTMKPKREGVVLLEVAEKQGLSLLDIDSVNRLYKCKPYDKLID